MNDIIDDYENVLESKRRTNTSTGLDVGSDPVNDMLYPFQKDIVLKALERGKYAVFADCGLGKTPIQLEWADHVYAETEGSVIIVAPLAVTYQTEREAEKFNIEATVSVVKDESNTVDGINIINYERLDKLECGRFAGVVLDESSILKDYTGKRRNQIIDSFRETDYKLACSATPAPNDYMELSNHSEFLDVMDRDEFLATFFVHDSSDTRQWRLKKHAQEDFWKWMASWAVAVSDPSDLGYNNDRFDLPEKRDHDIVVSGDITEGAEDGNLFRMPKSGIRGIQQEQRMTLEERCAKAKEIIEGADKSDYPWIVWCNRNDESTHLTKILDDAVEITGSDSSEEKGRKMEAFTDGEIEVLVTKASIAGHGMNWQHCSNMIFVGLTYSYEKQYQATRRCWRYGQDEPVDCYMITTPNESSVAISVESKKMRDNEMKDKMVSATSETWNQDEGVKLMDKREYKSESGDMWEMKNGDCVKLTEELEDDSVGLSIFSPPFSSLYTYSDAVEDMGNTTDDEEFFEQFKFLVDQLYRVTMPGRDCCVHLSNLMTTKAFDGQIGIRNFRGQVIGCFKNRDWIYHSEVCIQKDPVTAMQRTKAHGLLYKTLKKDAAKVRQGLADYVLVFRKPGENPEPVTNDEDDFPLERWQKWANPVWDDIDQGNVLSNYRNAREKEDERHICPLQLDLIERCMRLWSNEGDLVLDPFAGIGSTGHVALNWGREFVGIELKESYYQTACHNLKMAAGDVQKKLFEGAENGTTS